MTDDGTISTPPALVRAAEIHMKAARDLLRQAGTRHATDAVRRALQSIDGAKRAADRKAERTLPESP